jgi:hypothetical protein
MDDETSWQRCVYLYNLIQIIPYSIIQQPLFYDTFLYDQTFVVYNPSYDISMTL